MSSYPSKTCFSLGLATRLAFALTGVFAAFTVQAQTSLFFDFESPGFTGGSIMGQQGWSAGATGNTLLTDPSDFVTITSEAVTGAAVASGAQSWHYNHGITSGYQYGSGTPFSPNLGTSLANIGDQFSGSLKFKAVTMGDGSWMELDTGNPDGNDRSELIAYIDNYAGGTNLTVTMLGINATRDNYVELVVAQNLDAGWHQIDFTITRTGLESNSVSIMIDGSVLMSQAAEGALAFYREGFDPYAVSSRLKFAGSKTGDGFYIDDVAYTVTAVPEPAAAATIIGGLVLTGLVLRRSRKQAVASSA